MNIQAEAYHMLLSALGVPGDAEESVFRGLQQYIEDNSLEEVLSDCQSEEELHDLLSLFLSPLLSMPKERLTDYLSNYRLYADFDALSEWITQTAVWKYRHPGENCEEYESMSRNFAELASQIFLRPEVYQALKADISECVMDLRFIAGETDKTSVRLKYRA